MITVEDNPPLSFVIASGIIENIVNFAENSTDPYILFESCWIICNVASGSTTYTQTLFRYNIVNIFANLLKTKNTAVFELVVWAFGNLAGGEMKYRELILENDNVLSRILSYSSILNPPDSLITIVCWSLSNLVNVNNRTHQNQTIGTIPFFLKMIFHQNYQTVSDACWGLKYLTNGNIEIIKLVAKPKITKRFIDLLRINEPQIQIPALRCIINILAGSDEGIQQVIDSKGIEVLIELLQNQETQFRKESCWALSNICSGTPLQIQYLLDQKIIPYIIGMIETDPFAIKKEAIFLLSNIFHQGNEEQIEYLISLETLPIFCEMISCNEISIEKVCLGALKRALLFGKNLEQNKNNIIAQYLEERNIIQVISNLENSRDNEISSLSTQIIDGYFSESNNLAQMDEMDELN